MISTSNIEQARKEILSLVKQNKHPIIVEAQDDDFNRKILEYGKFDILLSLEKGNKKDKPKALDSGLNEVLCDIAAKNRISIGIDIEDIEKLEKKEKAQRLARIIQNIRLCRKSKTKLKIINYKDKKSAFSFLISLGASTQQAKEAIS